MSIGAILQAERLRIGASQEDIAAAAGIARTTLSRIEHGWHSPLMETLERLADALGCTVKIELVPIKKDRQKWL